MKLRQIAFAWLMALGLTAYAANTKTTVEQVTNTVQLTTDVDYIVTGTTPFATAGSVDIQSTDHAVLILSSIKPSKVLSSWMNYIYINGEKAVDGTNCQVKMYGRGTIVFPYSKDIQPLTCYTGTNFSGESYSNYSEGSSDGFMKTLSDKQFNNKIRSFKLKRGYMVTFAIGTSGWGYSRCFIADQEDLEVSTLPSILDKRISSYRIFKWVNAHKAGLASNGDSNANQALNTSWCYDWAQGNESNMPNTEWVPNHIYEDWPSPATCGGVTASCHMKTNNEPRNNSDDHPQDLKTILDNWQNLMRTGMRLCSPSSWDGSDYWNGTGFIKEFLDSIDARGWRCDIVDAHGYWNENNFNNLKTYWYPNMHRPIWISEWIWGASWSGGSGAFAYGVTNDEILATTQRILENLNSMECVERYAYWNSESKAHIYENGSLTDLGRYYATMDVGQGYKASMQFIPTNTRLEPLGELKGAYDKKKGTVALTWSDPNWDVMNSIVVQCKKPGASRFSTIANITPLDKNSANDAAYSYTETIEEPGAYTFRIQATAHNNASLETNEVTIDVAPAQGTDKYQYGTITISSADESSINYTTSLDVEKATSTCMFMGSLTNKNSSFRAGNYIANSYSKDYFSCQMLPWKDNTGTISSNEEIPFLAMPMGNYKYGDLDCEVGIVDSQKAQANNWTEVTEVTFQQPFPEGVTPVVLTEIRKPTSKNSVFCTRVFDITNKGFKFIIYPEESAGVKVARSQTVCYLAITPGISFMDEENGLLIAAGIGTDEDIYGISAQSNSLNLNLYQPTILTALQTNNYPAVCMLRRTNITTKDTDITWTTGFKLKRILDHDLTVDGKTISTSTSDEAYRDKVGWVALATYKEGGSAPTAIEALPTIKPHVVNGRVYVDGVSSFSIYNITGTPLASDTMLSPGIYVIKANGKSIKILVK